MWRVWQARMRRSHAAATAIALTAVNTANPADRPGGLRLPKDESGLRLPKDESGAVPAAQQQAPAPNASAAGQQQPQQVAAAAAGSDEPKKSGGGGGLLSKVFDAISESPRERLERAPGRMGMDEHMRAHTRVALPDVASTVVGTEGGLGSGMSNAELETFLHGEFPDLFPSEADIEAADARAAPLLPENATVRFERYNMAYRDSVWFGRFKAGMAFLAGGTVMYGLTELLSGPGKRSPYRTFLSGFAGFAGAYAYAMRYFYAYEDKLDTWYRVPPAGENICSALKYGRDLVQARKEEARARALAQGKTPAPDPFDPATATATTAGAAPAGPKYPWLPSFGPFGLINPKPKPLPKPVAGADRYYEPLPLWMRYQIGSAFVFLTGEREQRMCAACDRYKERIVRDARETAAVRARARALQLDARTELLVMRALAKKHEMRVWVDVDPYGPEQRAWTWRWLVRNLSTA